MNGFLYPLCLNSFWRLLQTLDDFQALGLAPPSTCSGAWKRLNHTDEKREPRQYVPGPLDVSSSDRMSVSESMWRSI